MGGVRNGCGHLVHDTQKSTVSKEYFMNWDDFLHADCEAISFVFINIILYIFDF